MRPTLQILTGGQIEQILAEAKRVLAEIGIEVRGQRLRQRLLEHGLPLDPTGQRMLFSRDMVERAWLSAKLCFTV